MPCPDFGNINSDATGFDMMGRSNNPKKNQPSHLLSTTKTQVFSLKA
ncbi:MULTISPECIES: hypothetical protein [unclassified Microcoleus]